MSTYWYLECLDHDPPLTSEDEVEQHTEGLEAIDALVARRQEITEEEAQPTGIIRPASDYFASNAARFLRQHPKCSLRYVSEYGHYRPILAPKGAPHV